MATRSFFDVRQGLARMDAEIVSPQRSWPGSHKVAGADSTEIETLRRRLSDSEAAAADARQAVLQMQAYVAELSAGGTEELCLRIDALTEERDRLKMERDEFQARESDHLRQLYESNRALASSEASLDASKQECSRLRERHAAVVVEHQATLRSIDDRFRALASTTPSHSSAGPSAREVVAEATSPPQADVDRVVAQLKAQIGALELQVRENHVAMRRMISADATSESRDRRKAVESNFGGGFDKPTSRFTHVSPARSGLAYEAYARGMISATSTMRSPSFRSDADLLSEL